MTNSTNQDPAPQSSQKESVPPSQPDPPKQANNKADILTDESEDIVNTDEQQNIVNTEEAVNVYNEANEDKRKGYEEGNKNDDLTEPESRDSDDQLEFPEEEGKM